MPLLQDDHDDPQLVTDYVNKIYIYLRKLEKEQNVEKDYLGNRRGGLVHFFVPNVLLVQTNQYLLIEKLRRRN